MKDRRLIHIGESWEKSNISSSSFNPAHPVKIIIHGYNSDMFLGPLIGMKDGKNINCMELESINIKLTFK